jgi:hypothetical protein
MSADRHKAGKATLVNASSFLGLWKEGGRLQIPFGFPMTPSNEGIFS